MRMAKARLVAAVVASTTTVAMIGGPALAKPRSGGGGSATPTGIDVSYPQCGTTVPTGSQFGIVGLNDGLANTLNPCFGPSSSYPSYTQSQLYWALSTTTGSPSEPKASVYVNTADPGNWYNGAPIADWPTSSASGDPYGACATTQIVYNGVTYTVGQNSPACAWEYGRQRAVQDATWLTQEASAVNSQQKTIAASTDPAGYPWWLDVETGNSWMSGSAGQQMNVADLRGMVSGLSQSAAVAGEPVAVGVYSTAYQWGTITGTPGQGAAGDLWGEPDWVPGASTLSGAEANCSSAAFTGGKVTVTQYTARSLDSDYACP